MGLTFSTTVLRLQAKEADLRHAGAPGRLCLGLFCLPFYTCFSFQLYRHHWDRTNRPIKENNMVTLKMGPLPPGQPGRSSVPEALGSGRAPSERAAGPAWCHPQSHMPLFTEVGPSCRSGGISGHHGPLPQPRAVLRPGSGKWVIGHPRPSGPRGRGLPRLSAHPPTPQAWRQPKHSPPGR